MTDRIGAVSLAWLIAFVVGCATSSLDPRDPALQESVDRSLAAGHDRDSLDLSLGIEPALCQASAPADVLCEWHLSRRQAVWQSLAEIMKTRTTISVICRLPRDGSPRAPGSCSAWPRKSNRLEIVPTVPAGQEPNPAEARKRAKSMASAEKMLDGAGTLPEMSWLLGAIPGECGPMSPRDATTECVWHLARYHYGHGTVVALVQGRRGDRVILRCAFPVDGSRRSADSCHAGMGN